MLQQVCLRNCDCFVWCTCVSAELAPGVTPSGLRVLRGEEWGECSDNRAAAAKQ